MNTYGLITILVVIAQTAIGQTDAVRVKHFNLSRNVAIDGYDPVTYFSGKPKEGTDEHALKYKGVTYYFLSSANLEKFRLDPDKYEPAYGGWCAYAMGESGEKVKVDPETFKIIDGKIYLFYNFWGNNTLEDWNESEVRLKPDADKNWLKLFR